MPPPDLSNEIDGTASTEADARRRLPWQRRASAVAAMRLVDLDPVARRRAVMVCAATVVLSWVFIFGAYFALPIGRESGLRALVRLGTDVALVGAVLSWQLRRISHAFLPELRSIEGLGVIIAVFLVAFSSTYLAMSHEAARTFTTSLDHIQALYFTISVFSTVGFGDITPRTDAARLVVSVQMLLDLFVIGAVVRIIFSAARNRVGASTATPASGHS
jgi:voltage-gated potassium channel